MSLGILLWYGGIINGRIVLIFGCHLHWFIVVEPAVTTSYHSIGRATARAIRRAVGRAIVRTVVGSSGGGGRRCCCNDVAAGIPPLSDNIAFRGTLGRNWV